MANAKTVLSLMAGFALASASTARAQAPEPATEMIYLNVSIGGQLADRSIAANVSKTVYEETATLTSSQLIGRGMIFDVSAGYRIMGDLFAGVSFSRFGDTQVADFSADIPDPIFFNRPKRATGSAADLKRSELSFSPHVAWAYPLTDKLDLAAGIGIAIISLKQDLLSDFTVAAGTQTPTVVVVTEKKTGVGPFAQVDFIYNMDPRWGIGGFARYAGAKVDLPSAADQNVGGMQAGGGVRLRF